MIMCKRKKYNKISLIHEERHNNHKYMNAKSSNIRIRIKAQNFDRVRQS